MFLRSIPLPARLRLNADYAAALRQVADAVGTASMLPCNLEFTSVVAEAGPEAPLVQLFTSEYDIAQRQRMSLCVLVNGDQLAKRGRRLIEDCNFLG